MGAAWGRCAGAGSKGVGVAWGLHGGGVGRLEGGAEEVLLGHPVEWVGPFGVAYRGAGATGTCEGTT